MVCFQVFVGTASRQSELHGRVVGCLAIDYMARCHSIHQGLFALAIASYFGVEAILKVKQLLLMIELLSLALRYFSF